MINKIDKNLTRKKRSLRVRAKVFGTIDRPRLNVYKSLNHIYAQIIDDVNGHTLSSASSLSKDVVNKLEGKTKTEVAYLVGEAVAKHAVQKGIKNVIFDRAGYIYTGRVKALAEGARKAGLEF